MTLILGSVFSILGLAMLAAFIGALREAVRERERNRIAQDILDRSEAAHDVQTLPDVAPDRVADYWDGVRDDDREG